MFIYVCDCIGLRNIVITKYMYLAMLYPINDLNCYHDVTVSIVAFQAVNGVLLLVHVVSFIFISMQK
jgi:hypothetical protein